MSAVQSNNNAPRTRTGCQNCRLRHLKCDEQRPSCTRCEKAGIECVRGYNIRFRHGANPSVSGDKGTIPAKSDYDFSKSQPWVNTARSLTFLDETQELISIYDHAAEPEVTYGSGLQWEDGARPRSSALDSNSAPSNSPAVMGGGKPSYDRTNSNGHASFSDISSPTKRRRLTFSSSYQASPSAGSPLQVQQSPAQSWQSSPHTHTGWTPGPMQDITSGGNDTIDEETAAALEGLEHTVSLGGQSFTAVSESLSRIYLDAPVWPLESREEAHLLRYYVHNLARNFDLTDPLKHFRNVVPQRAATCPSLLNAILALSARHLSRVGQYDPLISNRYHQECLKHLIPMLDDTTAILDENLLASTIILRHLEEIEVPLSGQSPSDQQSHLFGAHAFMNAQERSTISGGLRLAAFWTGLRQEIYVAFVNQRSIIPTLEHCNIDRTFDAASDDIWANRMVVLCADVIRWCFDDADPGSQSTFTYLADSVAQWHTMKPASFTPIYQRPANLAEGKAFPELWYVGDDIMIGLHHYHLARILLSSHNPRIPRLGPGRASALRQMDDEIREHVRALCGITVSNSSMPPNYTYASMGVTMAGDKFTDRREQEALLEVLETCDRFYAWPTGNAVRNLKDSWGWAETPNDNVHSV